MSTQGKFKEAKEEFEKALKIDPYYGSVKRALKVIEDVTGKKIERDTAIHLFKGIAYAIKRQVEEAISELNKAIDVNPKYADAYNNRGNAYDDIDQYDQAISDYNKAIEIEPRNAITYNNRGSVYDKKRPI